MFHLSVHMSRQTAHHSRKNHPVYSKMNVKKDKNINFTICQDDPFCCHDHTVFYPDKIQLLVQITHLRCSKIIYRHSFNLSKPVCGEHKMTDRESEDREMLSSQRCLPSHLLNPWRGYLVLDPRCAFQVITPLHFTFHTYTSA